MPTEENRPNGQSRTRIAASVHAARALDAAAGLWERRLANGWTPPPSETPTFPWEMTRLSLAALLPGMSDATAWRQRCDTAPVAEQPCDIALILAGNTPLMSWSPIAACLLAGHRVTVKMSSHDTLWPRLFVEALAEVAPRVASQITLESWPGSDPRTAELIRSADAVVAFGSDSTLATLRALTPAAVAFFGFGHAVSVGLWTTRSPIEASDDFGDWLTALQRQGAGFAHDILLYNQSGCLSPQTIFVEETDVAGLTESMGELLADWLDTVADNLAIPPVTDHAVARAVRTARDLALFDGTQVTGSPDLRWTIVVYPTQRIMPAPSAHGVISLVPISDATILPDLFGDLEGKISSIGVAGSLSPSLQAALTAQSISRICPPGEMQTPPLDWPNGNIDLLAELLRI